MNSNLQSIIVGVVQVVATLVATVLVDRAGRKILLTLSDIIMCISLVMLGVFFYLKDEAEDPVYEDIGSVKAWLLFLLIFVLMLISLIIKKKINNILSSNTA